MGRSIVKIYVVGFLAFLTGNQLVHAYMNPLGNVNQIAEEKKRQLWKEYLEKQDKKSV